jgi:hypothetical protein
MPKATTFQNLVLNVRGNIIVVSGTYVPGSPDTRYVQGDPPEVIIYSYTIQREDPLFIIGNFDDFFETYYFEFADQIADHIYGKETWVNSYID